MYRILSLIALSLALSSCAMTERTEAPAPIVDATPTERPSAPVPAPLLLMAAGLLALAAQKHHRAQRLAS